ncbi:hypothetical protein QVH35_09365 [Candidatus Nitrosotenuis chungbukensis]|uniref:hypothetical protein n=1 Tax=Candidatus Nitrosotenuis chungbukensis TaxID=1353246 RepID=UPI0026725D31|nr:hypothetical protein [Candidatus Nitrosotenuis chungbukensis]WKT57556.1 hypothetical protein QVH35_09365 [Candidatus Nitrosotenuis chungbukensis]
MSGIELEKVTNEMGSATEDQKSVVRSQIDFIRMTLQTMLSQYKEGNTQAAFVSARTAYLDSYEHVEIPLRTIDPDFTLQVELQFAEARSLINQKADYDKIEQATISVRRSLDESERLVTGTGQACSNNCVYIIVCGYFPRGTRVSSDSWRHPYLS